jgi:cyclic pyranopterin phosphate synthase
MRRDLEEIIAGIASVGGVRDLCMTTNAQGLGRRVRALKDAGLRRVNISIDSLKPERYKKITGGGDITEVLEGIELSVRSGLDPVKLNAVLIRGENDDEVDDFIKLAKDMPVEVRFIELMPFTGRETDKAKGVSSRELIEKRPYLIPVKPDYESQPAENYAIEGYAGKVGFISPMSHKFCGVCNRIRITSDGMLKPCLGNNGESDLTEALREGDEQLLLALEKGIYEKPAGHSFEQGFDSERGMRRIGG